MKFLPVAVGAVALSCAVGGTLVLTGVVDKDALIQRAFAAVQLSDAELQGKLQAQGYTNVQILQHEGNRTLVSATKDGDAVQLSLNASTGRVAGDDDDDDD